MNAINSEQARINQIRKNLSREGIGLENFASSDYPGVALHSNSTIIEANEVAEQMFGYNPGELSYQNAWTLFPPESGPALMQHLINHSEEPYRVTARRKDGSKFRVELKGLEFGLEKEIIRAVILREIKD